MLERMEGEWLQLSLLLLDLYDRSCLHHWEIQIERIEYDA